MLSVTPQRSNAGRVTSGQQPVNALSFDVEAWFHAHNLGISPHQWHDLDIRLERPIHKILALLERYEVKATFFVLGWVARQRPDLVQRISHRGHQIACHGMMHQPLGRLSPNEFRHDVTTARDVLQEITGKPVIGYRAPSYSITQETSWALDILADLGFRYDSSIYPVRAPHGRYGIAGAPRKPFQVRAGLTEFPLPIWKIGAWRMPALTGGYLRLFPRIANRVAMAQNARDGVPVVINLHPWEFDPDQPRVKASLVGRCLHYQGLGHTHARLSDLLERYMFAPLECLCRNFSTADVAHGAVQRQAREVVISPGKASGEDPSRFHRESVHHDDRSWESPV
ncbi:MAG: XrtA system polysaccharide deacetylase [Planctomycetota bacterium]